MAWAGPEEEKPVWCSVGDDKTGTPTAQSVNCVTKDPSGAGPEVASLNLPAKSMRGLAGDVAAANMPVQASYQKFTSQMELGHFLEKQYHIRTPRELTSCEVCHR
jgi:hypothetical protein